MKKFLLISFVFVMAAMKTYSQTNLDSLDAKVTKMDKLLGILREFRISGFVQTQYQLFDSLNADPTYVGGGTTAATRNRFAVRRGRFRIGYEHDNNKGFKVVETAFQFEATERGFSIKDFYGRVIDPWTGWIGLQAGIFIRPLGWETYYGDNMMESPERARFVQILNPGERDLGGAIVVESPKTFKPVYLRLDAGLFNGLPNNVVEFDKRKDFIGRLQVRKTFGGDKFKFTVGVAPYLYMGGVMQSTVNYYNLQKDTTGVLRYTKNVDSAGLNNHYQSHTFYGADLQLMAEYGIGWTILRGEFVMGQQPGTSTGMTVATTASPGVDLYVRKMNGAVFYFVQGFKHKIKGQQVKHELVVKYDWWDPNTQLTGKDISTTNDSKVSKADVKFSTLGIGYSFIPADFFKLMIYYDFVTNEKTFMSAYDRNLKDNVLTIRTQFTFDSNWFKKK